ncbi:MAG: hypothetical protein Tsb0017_12120 [Geothermobacteraceae bacterium]
MLTACYYRLLGRARMPLLAVLLGLTLALLPAALNVTVEQDNASMAGDNSERRQVYDRFLATFGPDNLLIAGVQPPQGQAVDDAVVQRLVHTMKKQPRIAQVITPSDHGNGTARIPSGLLKSSGSLLPILILPQPVQGLELQRLIANVRATGQDLPAGYRLRLTGIAVQKADVARAIQHDQSVIIPLSVLVLALLLLLLYRRLVGVLLPLAVMGMTLCWTIGLYSLAGLRLNTVTSLLPPVVMVLAVATCVHLLQGWQELATEKGERRSLLAHRMADLTLPCAMTSFTTALGLVSLCSSEIPAVRQFGLFGAVAALLALLLALLVVPILLSFLPLPPRRDKHKGRRLRRLLRGSLGLALGRARPLVVLALAVTLLAGLGISHLENDTNLVHFFPRSEPLRQDTEALEQVLGGVEPLELMITLPRALSPGDVTRLALWQQELEQAPEISVSFSLASLLPPQPSPLLLAGAFSFARLLDSQVPDEIRRRLVSVDHRQLRLSLYLRLLGSDSAERLATRLEREGERRLGEGTRVQATGAFYQIASDSNRLVRSLIRSFSLSVILVLGAILLGFRNLKLLAVAMVPNLVPLVWTLGLMGWSGIRLNTGTAMIAAVTFGMVVDDTIHFLHRYRRETAGYAKPALIRTGLGVGPALLISTLVLVSGFWTGLGSSFLPTVWFALLTGTTLITALVCDLMLLPALLLLWDHRDAPTRGHSRVLEIGQ